MLFDAVLNGTHRAETFSLIFHFLLTLLELLFSLLNHSVKKNEEE
jgi:hypothetical protein